MTGDDREVAQPHMEMLVAEVNESSSVSVLDESEIVYVARVPTRRIMSLTLAAGTRLPAYATATGRVLLAGLEPSALAARLEQSAPAPLTPHTVTDRETLTELLARVREDGYAAVDQELEEGLRSLAVPIHDATGGVIAALNVSVHASRGTMAALRRDFLGPASRAAGAIESDLRASACG